MDIEAVAQSVYSNIEKFFPSGWSQVIFYAEYPEDAFSMEFYVSSGIGAFTKCFDLPGMSADAFLPSFEAIDAQLSNQRRSLKPKDLWTNITITIESSGSFKIDFGYEDLMVFPYRRKNNWKKKYLSR